MNKAQEKVVLTGGADISQGTDIVRGDSISAQLFPDKTLQNAVVTGNAFSRQTTPERTTEVNGGKLNVVYGQNRQIASASLVGEGSVSVIPTVAEQFSKATLTSLRGINVGFDGAGNARQISTDGRTTMRLDAPNNNPESTNKKVTADTVKTVFQPNGGNIARVEAVGNAEVYVEPVNAGPSRYKTTINASRFDCEFFPTGNNVKNCTGVTKTRVLRVPTQTGSRRGNQTLSADKLSAVFNSGNQDIQQMDASGNAKFNEGDRNGIASLISYTAGDEFVRLRGGEPTVFDSRARARAGEIDWDTRNQKTFLRNKVSTTYFSQRQTGGATPFAKAASPVFLTSDTAQFDIQREVGIYNGNARAWQDNNYVRANELVIYQKERRFEGEGNVQSLLYNERRRDNAKVQTVYASAGKLRYTESDRLLHYEDSVDIRQGTDRLTSSSADIYLTESNEMKQTVLQGNVVITQPKRRVAGSWVQYNAIDETAILRGNPAVIEDAERGATQGSEISFSMRENIVVNQGTKTAGGAGRTRTVYKVKNP
jgi:lipopolysaccharide transport protein LptA